MMRLVVVRESVGKPGHLRSVYVGLAAVVSGVMSPPLQERLTGKHGRNSPAVEAMHGVIQPTRPTALSDPIGDRREPTPPDGDAFHVSQQNRTARCSMFAVIVIEKLIAAILGMDLQP